VTGPKAAKSTKLDAKLMKEFFEQKKLDLQNRTLDLFDYPGEGQATMIARARTRTTHFWRIALVFSDHGAANSGDCTSRVASIVSIAPPFAPL
jgi:hypothetical protein